MEKEICETYRFVPSDYDELGRRKDDGKTFRDVVKDFERDFHDRHSTEYALNLYANSSTMRLLAKSNGAEPFMIYGMDLCHVTVFNPKDDPDFNFQIDLFSEFTTVYAIDSAFMTDFNENGYPVFDDDSEVYPLTLLIDEKMRDGETRLTTPTTDDDDEEPETIINDVPKKEYV